MTRFYSATAQPTTLSAACTNSATSIVVTATTGFPAVEFILALDYGGAAQELVKVTGVAGTTLTVVRGFDSTTAQAHAIGAVVTHVHSADDFRLSRTHEGASTGVHGATGALVGTTDAQALTNKDLTAGTNTFPATLAAAADLTAHTGATAAHGATGAGVGTTNAQALSNKDLTSGTNTFPTSLATLTGAQTLTNKTLTSPSITIGGLPAEGIVVCTSATRPSHSEGRKIYETDTDRELTSDGTNWVRTGGRSSETGSSAATGLTTTPTGLASVTVPPGRWSFIGKVHLEWSIASLGEVATLDLHDGTTQLDKTTHTYAVTNGSGGAPLLYTATLAAATTVSLRASTSGLDGTQNATVKLTAIPG